MLKKVGAMIDNIYPNHMLMLLYLAHPFLGPRIGWFQKPSTLLAYRAVS